MAYILSLEFNKTNLELNKRKIGRKEQPHEIVRKLSDLLKIVTEGHFQYIRRND